MNRTDFEAMLQAAIIEASEEILTEASRKAKKPSAATLRLMSQHPITDSQSRGASRLSSAACCDSGFRLSLQSSADLPPCF